MDFKKKLSFSFIFISILLILCIPYCVSASNTVNNTSTNNKTSNSNTTENKTSDTSNKKTNTNSNNTVTEDTNTKKASSKIDISKNYQYYISLQNYFYQYTGKEIKPKITVYKSNEYPTHLKEGTDYTVSYKNNININTDYSSDKAQVIVKGKGKYTGTLTTTFTICKYDISKAKVSNIPDQEYTGKLINPVPKKVTYNNKVLTEGIDYTISYNYSVSGCTPVGTAYLTIVGQGDFFGSTKYNIPYKVLPKKVSNVKVTLKTDGFKIDWDKVTKFDFDGYTIFRTTSTTKNLEYKEIATVDTKTTTYLDTTPETTGKTYYYKVCTYKLVNGVKYYSFDSNIEKKVFAQGVTFSITSNNDSTYLKWDEVKGATGYQIFRATEKNGTYEMIKTRKGQLNCSFTDKTVKPYTTYYYKIRSYANTDSKKVYSKFTGIQQKTALAKTKLKKVEYTGSSIKLNWNQVNNIKGYKIYRATSENGKYKRIAIVSSKKTSYTDKNLSQGKVYYYKISAYKIKGKNELHGQYSDIKSAVTGNRNQQLNKTTLTPDKNFKNSGFNNYYKRYQQIINKVSNSNMSTYSKVKAMYKYVVQNLYHKDGYNCKNFAGTFAGMCRVLGLDAYCATGQTRASGGGYTAHTWTIVDINGTEYIFDASLDRHAADRTKKSTSYNYFFKTYDELPGVYKISGYDNWWPYAMVYLKK